MDESIHCRMTKGEGSCQHDLREISPIAALVKPERFGHRACHRCGRWEQALVEADARRPVVREESAWMVANKDLPFKVERMKEALFEIITTQGKVCKDFQFCKHASCRSSCHSYFIAEQALKDTGMFVRAPDEGDK